MYFVKKSKNFKVKSIAVLQPKNDVTKYSKTIIHRLRFFILFQLLLGVNRLYLLHCKYSVFVISCIYSTLLSVTVTGSLYFIKFVNTSHFVLKVFAGTEYSVLTLSALFLMKNRFIKFFRNLQSFDEALNIDQYVLLTTPIIWHMCAIVVLLSYNLIEYLLTSIYVGPNKWVAITLKLTCLSDTIHDLDMLFFCALLIFIKKRLCVLKAHTFRLFHEEQNNNVWTHFDEIENLSKNRDLDIISLHKAYDHLHKCSYQLNFALSFPITVMLFSSAATNIILVKNSFILIQQSYTMFSYKEISDVDIHLVVIYSIGRFSKNSVLLVLLCFCSQVTKTQVTVIRSLLCEALSTRNLEKIERRKIKAFLQMTHDNEFSYSLCGVFKLNMSLPLKYYFISLTYLIMIYQFSKFME